MTGIKTQKKPNIGEDIKSAILQNEISNVYNIK